MVKGVATSIITVAVLMGSLVACGGSDNQLSEEEKNEWIILCSSVAVDGTNCARLAQLIEELVSEKGWDKDCLKEEYLIMFGYESRVYREMQNEIAKDKCAPKGEEIESTNDDSQSYSPPASTPFPTSTPQPTPTPRPEPTPTPEIQDQIVFINDNNLFIMNIDGTNVQQLTDIEGGWSDGPFDYDDYAWSPDGNKIAYVAFDDIYVVEIDELETQQLTYGNLFEGLPVWSPNGNLIYFSRHINPDNPSEGMEGYSMRTYGSDVRQLGCMGQISPNGGQIVWGGSHIYVSDSDCNNTRQLTNEEDKGAFNLQWSPDGKKIAFVACQTTCFRMAPYEIFTIDVGTSPTFSSLNRLTFSDTGGVLMDFDWSPDGNQIAFSQRGYSAGKNVSDIFVMSSNGSNLQKITANGFQNSAPSFSSDGRHIVFTSDSSSSGSLTGEIVIADLEGSDVISTGQEGSFASFRPR